MIPAILSGGSGTRLWPVSREKHPKQFCDFFQEQSFLRATLERVRFLEKPWIVTLNGMEAPTRKLLDELHLATDQILLEPLAKNTAPAIALLCRTLKVRGLGHEIVAVLPADHFISQPNVLLDALNVAEAEARNGQIALLGIRPSYAATGYGYIELDAPANVNQLKSHSVLSFREKPDAVNAERMSFDPRFYWNAGIFVFQVDVLIRSFEEYLPDLWSRIQQIDEQGTNAKYVYANISGISFDYGVVEKAKNISCVPCDPGWSDVGSWDEVSRLSETVPVSSQARVVLDNAPNNFVFSNTAKTVALNGVDHLLVVDTPDGLLISRKGESQNVKNLVEQMGAQGVSFEGQPEIQKLIVDPEGVPPLEEKRTYWLAAGRLQLNGKSLDTFSTFQFRAGDRVKAESRVVLISVEG